MYNHIDAKHVSEFELHNITARLVIMYNRTLEYSKLQLYSKRDCLRTTNLRNLKIMAKQVIENEAALDSFTIQR